jgi:nucleoside 2-deoxyribosyltransferase
MRRISTVFLSGPDRWAPDAEVLTARKRALVEGAGLEALTGRPDLGAEEDRSEMTARAIYADDLSRLRRADAVIANLTPWRGVGCEPGTAFETGFAAALGKPVFAYLNVLTEEEAELRARVDILFGAQMGEDGLWRDPDGAAIEDFGLPESFMLWAEARRFFVVVTPDPLGDCTGVELCLEALRLYADA